MEKYLLLILGAIIGFIASIAKDYFVEKTKKKYKDIDFKREKLEELFILVCWWRIMYQLQTVKPYRQMLEHEHPIMEGCAESRPHHLWRPTRDDEKGDNQWKIDWA